MLVTSSNDVYLFFNERWDVLVEVEFCTFHRYRYRRRERFVLFTRNLLWSCGRQELDLGIRYKLQVALVHFRYFGCIICHNGTHRTYNASKFSFSTNKSSSFSFSQQKMSCCILISSIENDFFGNIISKNGLASNFWLKSYFGTILKVFDEFN